MNKGTIRALLFPLLLQPFLCATSQSHVELHLGPAVPVSEYGVYRIHTFEGDYLASGVLGVDAGCQYGYQWSEKGFGLFLSADFILGRVNKDWVNKCFEMTFNRDLERLPVYLYLPLSAGLSYRFLASESFSLTAQAGMIWNEMKVTDNVWEDYRREVDWSAGWGFKAGLGILLREKYSVGITYLGLGKHEIWERLISVEYPTIECFEMDVHLLTLTAGWVF